MFGGGWFAIDAANRRVPGVTPGTLDHALSLVGRGWVASIVGRLRAEVRVVDVDLAGDRGLLATRWVADWCQDRGLWHLVRVSGGGRGRGHVFVVPGVHLEALDRYLGELRAELRASRPAIDLRQAVRPLSAPHRRTGATPPPADASGALAALRAVLEPVPDRIVARRAAAADPIERRPGFREPLVPMSRRRRPLPPAWAAYLERGRAAAAGVDVDASQRSLIESMATFQLVICGYSEPEAWAAITAAHPTAFVKAREAGRGRSWWWTVWNAAVREADAWRRENRSEHARETLAETRRAHAVLEASWRAWPTRTRHVDREVAIAVLDVMDRVGQPAAQIAQRELLLSCAVSSRGTVRQALDRLEAVGMLTVHATYVPGTADSSNSITLGPACNEHAIATGDGAVSVDDPHVVSHPCPPLPLRAALGLRPSALLTHLPPAGSPTGLTAVALAHLAGLAESDAAPTARQLRTAREHLRVLSEYGLASVDSTGQWRAASDASQQVSARRRTLLDVGTGMGRRKHEAVQEERTTFRAVIDGDQRRARWVAQRARAFTALPKADVVLRRRQWWAGLGAHERATRAAHWQGVYAGLSLIEQARYKARRADARAAAGIDEVAEYRKWLTSTPSAELEARSQEFALRFAALDPLSKAEKLLHLSEHRLRHGLPAYVPRRAPAESRAALPEHGLLTRPHPSTEDLVLLDERDLAATSSRNASARTGT